MTICSLAGTPVICDTACCRALTLQQGGITSGRLTQTAYTVQPLLADLACNGTSGHTQECRGLQKLMR